MSNGRKLLEKSSGSGIDIGFIEIVIPLDPFLQVDVGTYKHWFKSKTEALEKLLAAHFKKKRVPQALKIERQKRTSWSRFPIMVLLKARLRETF